MTNNGEILAECSDDEEYDKFGSTYNGFWGPKPEVFVELFESITKDKILELDWKCPGRKNPEEAEAEKVTESVDKLSVANESSEMDKNFDFEEESAPMVRKIPSKTNLPKGSGKKRSTSLQGILENMKRHGQI